MVEGEGGVRGEAALPFVMADLLSVTRLSLPYALIYWPADTHTDIHNTHIATHTHTHWHT